MYKPKGSYSAAMFDAVRRAEEMQAAVLSNINGKFKAEKPAKDLYELTWEQFINELEEAYANDSVEELNARYAQMLQPLVEMAMQPQPEGGQ